VKGFWILNKYVRCKRHIIRMDDVEKAEKAEKTEAGEQGIMRLCLNVIASISLTGFWILNK
jgi:hypothetical protein